MASPQPKNLIQLQDASKSFGSKTLFEGATFSVNENEHIGVIGPNGAGKTTLFKLLAGEIECDDGEVVRSRSLRLGYLQQHDTWDESETLETFLSNGTHMPIWDLRKLGLELGLHEEQYDAPIKSMSGGYRMRAKLLHLLGQEPNLMMLDEPTNYLDLETLLVLEKFLQEYEGSFLLISHDREFLRRTTSHILEIENGDFVKYSGNIDDYFEQKQMLREQMEKRVMTDAAKRQEVLDFAARFGAKASKARQVQSRIRQMEKMETIELKPLAIGAKVKIPEPTHTGRIALEIKDADLGYPERMVTGRVSIKIETGDHFGVVGYNGAGKSTLLKSIAKELEPLYGEIEWGYQVTAGYYAQHVSERLNHNHTVLDALSSTAHNSVRQQEILDVAGSLLFSGDNVKKKISVLSGGEKARVALGQILLKRAPLLILDEPTNHLDFYTVESMTQALHDYRGTIIFVSHDRGFVRRVATKILEVKAGRVQVYPGLYDDYVWSVQRSHQYFEETAAAPLVRRTKQESLPVVEETLVEKAVASSPAVSLADKSDLKELESERRICDKQIQDLDKKIKILEKMFSEQGDKLSQVQGTEAATLSRELSVTQRKISELETEMMATMEKRESLLLQIKGLR